MDILKASAIEFPCDVCGGRRAVSLRQVLLAQDQLTLDGCCAPEGERECPPATFAPLADHDLIVALQSIWQRLEEQARAAGGELTVGATAPAPPSRTHIPPL
jgi:hypothetical protein